MTSESATPTARARVTVLGLGAMGSALAARLLDTGHRVTVWNRTPGRDASVIERGGVSAPTITDAVAHHPVVVACLLRHASIHETLDPVAAELRGRTLVNLTTTTPNEARELAAWAGGHGITYLDGAILAVPEMIGTPDAQIFYSGSHTAYEQHKPVLDTWATSTFDGADAGMASLIDLAMLSGMYQMFAGFFHGVAMVGSEGMSAQEFADRTGPFIKAMTDSFAGYAEIIDRGDYTVPGQQSLEFSDLSHIVRASNDQGVNPATIAAVHDLIRQQIAAGHGGEGLARVHESMRANKLA